MTDPRLTLWGIEVFLAAAEEGSISAAARRLSVSPSAVSQQLSAMEGALGTPLLDRASRPMGVTPAGQVFRRHARTMLDAAAEARADLAAAGGPGLMTLRLGMIEDLDADVTPGLLAGLAEDLRGCRFLLETGPSHRLVDQLEARALDIAVAAGDAALPPADYETHPLLAEPFVVVLPRAALAPDDLTGWMRANPLIQYSTRHVMGRQIAAHLVRQDQRFAAPFEADSYHAILAMVAAGSGWTILTPLGLHHASRFAGQVEVRPLPFAPLERRIALTARAGVLRDRPARVAAMLRDLLGRQVVRPARAAMPWLGDSLRVL